MANKTGYKSKPFTKATCAGCKKPLSGSPETTKQVKTRTKKVKFLCTNCVSKKGKGTSV